MNTVSLRKGLAFLSGLFVAGIAMLFMPNLTPIASATTCVKGDVYSDFTGTVTSKDTITVQTKNNVPLCNDVQINMTSYSMPLTYVGPGFTDNPTAIPQYMFANNTVTMKKGETKIALTVKVPDECTPYQIDAYLGPVIKEVTTNAGINVNGRVAIKGKIFDKTKTDCSVPKVKACNINTHLYEMVDKGKENTPPYTTNFDNCELVTVCNTETGKIEKDITKEQAKDSKYADESDDACNPPDKVKACNVNTHKYEMVDEGKQNTSPYTTNFDNCEFVTVCNTVTGEVEKDITKEQAKDSKYADESDKACNPPEEIPSTGPAEIISGVFGMGSLAGAGSMYIKSRRSLFNIFK